MTVSKPAPSCVPTGWWECIGLGHGAGPKAIKAGGDSSGHTAPEETSLPQIAPSRNLEQQSLLVERPIGRPGRVVAKWVLAPSMELGRGSRPALGEKTEAEYIRDAALVRPAPPLSSPLLRSTNVVESPT